MGGEGKGLARDGAAHQEALLPERRTAQVAKSARNSNTKKGDVIADHARETTQETLLDRTMMETLAARTKTEAVTREDTIGRGESAPMDRDTRTIRVRRGTVAAEVCNERIAAWALAHVGPTPEEAAIIEAVGHSATAAENTRCTAASDTHP